MIELKRGRPSDAVVGQILRYMGEVSSEFADKSQIVKGAIIALDDDVKIKKALSMTNNIKFYRYQVDFKLISDNKK